MRPSLTISLAVAALLLAPLSSLADATLRVAAPFEIVSPDPTVSGSIFTRMGVAETLVEVDAEGRLTPGLATAWEVSADGLTWRFAIRDGVAFHDGTPLTAAATAGALEIARAKPGLLDRAPITAIAAGDGAVVVTLSAPFAALPAFLAEYRSQILAPASYGADGAATSVIGTGPYRIETLTPPQSLTATAHAGYWGPAPTIADVAYTAVGRAETRALMAESGDAEFVYALDPATVTRLRGSDEVTVHAAPIPRSLLLKVNAAHPFLDSAEARRALSLAIDRQGLAQAVLRYPEGADQLFPPSVAGWHSDALEPLAHDPDEARRLLAGLGWTPGADGVLERDGRRFELTLTTYPDRPELPLAAAVLEQMFRAVGVALTIDSTNSSEIPARHAAGTLELGLLARNFALVPDPIGTILQDYAPTGDWGAMGWENAAFVDLANRIARGEAGAAARAEAAAILQADLPVIPIAWYQQTLAASNRVAGAAIDPWERSFGLSAIRWAD
ncbi:ABC transporter substrate-binding protein [Rubrimonas cliftonensis]|uniref:Peptide/nickel transport system substrate-binding protein n=1 Tax=Rubrimonas cliftonensis TaxID=89524 RepID=A0A1H4FCZ6_9RHOB|nr:ABC transporter substrate-binding protein [Rubrimonas cliftonensis]SEA94608.1 peptide/nickel transport system substrate-binding protein [Rubrimonas cliftonensis]